MDHERRKPQKFFGLNLDAEGGANLQQFFDESGIDLEKLNALLRTAKDKETPVSTKTK